MELKIRNGDYIADGIGGNGARMEPRRCLSARSSG